ncbi:cytochrome c3 family protein [Porticoccus sp.]
MKKWLWFGWIVVSLGLASYYGYTFFQSENKQNLLIGDASYGHYQIELACSACHTEAFGGQDSIQKACVGCHAEELDAAHDSHPKKKFTDPRNADLLAVLDARYCVSCHTEHQQEQTHPMGLTLPKDYCFHCHQDIGEDRESHKNLAFDSCASAGCHNYHDNRALYEDFLLENHQGAWVNALARITSPNAAAKLAPERIPAEQPDFPQQVAQHPDIHSEWSASSHAEAGVSCGGCHSDATTQAWVEKPGIEQCQTCHLNESNNYKAGKHGMRLAQSLSAISPVESHLPFKEQALSQHQGCNSCHGAHETDTQFAAAQACLGCHNDQHSLAFETSPHGKLLSQAIAGALPVEQAVTCATCHMPREEKTLMGHKVIQVNHNQNDNLRPNEKMIRPVCMQCHNLSFAIDALADPVLIDNNFNGKPSQHTPSIDWARRREAK